MSLGGVREANGASTASFERTQTTKGKDWPISRSLPAPTRLVFSNDVHTINLLHKFLFHGELGGNVTYFKLAAFKLMSFYCLPGRFGDEKEERKINEVL